MNFEKIVLSLAIVLLGGCTPRESEIDPQSQISGFNVQTDLSQFSEKMARSGTLLVLVDFSACTMRRYERILFTVEEGQVLVQTTVEITFDDVERWDFGKVAYHNQAGLENNLESLFLKLDKELLKKGNSPHPTFTFISRQDTIKYTASGLTEIFRYQHLYSQSMQSLYPEAEI
jgi:hypothetical protein